MKTKFLLLILLFTVSTVSFGQIYFEDGFETNIDAWSNIDNDGDTNIWDQSTAGPHTGSNCVTSASWNGSALTPDNYLVTPAIDLEDATGNITLEYWVRAQDQNWPSEHYSCLISTVDGTVANLTTVLMSETLTTSSDAANNLYVKRSIDLSAYAGEFVWIAWEHHDCTDFFRLNLDDVVVFSNSVVDAGITAVTAPSNDTDCALSANEDVTMTIFNYGGADITGFDVSYSINGGPAVTETFTGTIGASSSMDYTFTQQADMSALGYYTVTGSVALTDDSDATNNSLEVNVANGDANIVVEVLTDNQSGQSWEITNSNGDVVGSHGGYQWDITETTTVCVVNDDCYTFSWTGGTSNTVTLNYNGTLVNQTIATGDYEVYPIGGGCAADDVSITSVNNPSVMEAATADISGTVRNLGSMPLTSFDVTYNVDGGAESTVYSVSGVNIMSSATYDFVHDVPFDFTSGSHVVNVTVSNPNGMTDPSMNNNMASGDVLVVNEAFPQVVVGEEATGTWCQFCPRGTVALTDMAHNVTDGSWIGIAVHNGDPMTNAEYDAGIGNYITGYPSGAMMRAPGDPETTEEDPSNFPNVYQDYVNRIPLAKVEISKAEMDDARQVTVDASAIFALDMTGNTRLSCIIVENGLTGTTAAWDQVNAYDGGAFGPLADWTGFDWTTAGNPVSGLTYNHVGREIIGGFTGVDGSVPSDVTYNTNNDYTFNFELNPDYNEDSIEIVVLLLNADDGSIINAKSTDLDVLLSNVFIGNPSDVKVFPNPTTGLLTIDAKANALVKVYNIVGQMVHTSQMNADVETMDLSELGSGTYFVEIFDNNTLYSKKVILTK